MPWLQWFRSTRCRRRRATRPSFYVQTWNEVGSLLTYWKKPDPDSMIEVLVP